MSRIFGITDAEMEYRLGMVRELVGGPMPTSDPDPGRFADNLLVGNKFHAAQVDKLLALGVTAVLNCAPSGISSVPLDLYREKGLKYAFTNVKRDDATYPILHDDDGVRSPHLDAAKAFFEDVVREGGRALFFCVAGQNRSATLAIAVLLLGGQSLQKVLLTCTKSRPFVVENEGFQRQLVELESLARKGFVQEVSSTLRARKRLLPSGHQIIEKPSMGKRSRIVRKDSSKGSVDPGHGVEVELRVPGLACFDVPIPEEAMIAEVKAILVERANRNLTVENNARVGKAWLVFSMFGSGICFDLVLEEEAVEVNVQIARLHNTYGLDIVEAEEGDVPLVRWTPRCRFELVIFSLVGTNDDGKAHKPFTFRHQERRGVPGTLLVNNNIEIHLRAWDLISGEGFRSKQPIVFSFSEDGRNKRDFREVSKAKNEDVQCFETSDDLSILGMGANAIVHRVQLQVAAPYMEGTETDLQPFLKSRDLSFSLDREWDAAVKRPFTVGKMLCAMERKSEAGMAKRLRMAATLNRQGRLLYFYGLGIALSSNADNREEFKFELTLLSRYQEDFSTYTLKKFLDDYTTVLAKDEPLNPQTSSIRALQEDFSLIKVKVLLVSLLNGFRDLTLMGIQAYDFNHLDNVLISRDYRQARLIDIDGLSKGSIQFPSAYFGSTADQKDDAITELHKPALDIDLSTLLPLIVQQLILGKGRGKSFVSDCVSKIWRARSDDDARELLVNVIRENFFEKPRSTTNPSSKAESPSLKAIATPPPKLLRKVSEWTLVLLKKREPWANWTTDIYDAMRCIDHLPIG